MHATRGKKLGAVLSLLLLVPTRAHAADDRAALDALVGPFLKDKPYLGLVVGITRPAGRQVLGYGHVTLAGKRQVPTGNTLFEIGSITKVFTGTLLADQVLAGTVHLDDPVQQYLPDGLTVPRRDGRAITLLHLATHTSSLPVQPPGIGLLALLSKDPLNPYAEYRLPQLKHTLADDIKLTRPIGSRFEYSNLGVGLLGHALAHAAKAGSYEALLVRRLAQPLALADTRIRLAAEQDRRLAGGHTRAGKAASPWTFACLEACGGLRSTPNDLLTFAEAALGRRSNPLAAAFRMAHEPWRETCRTDDFVGLCWMRKKLPGTDQILLWHNGGTGGYRGFLGLLPESGVGLVVLSNSEHSVDALAVTLLKHLAQAGETKAAPQGPARR